MAKKIYRRWILGGMLALGAAVATAADEMPAPKAAAADLTPVIATPNARTQLPPGQVWECSIGGQRVFSDTQCGAHASIRQLNEVNAMSSSASFPSVNRFYGAPQDSPAPDSQAPPDYSGDPYVSQPFIVVHDGIRRYHFPRRTSHPRGRSSRP